MNIYLAVKHSNDPSQFHSRLWISNFLPALERMGHEVIISTIDLAPTSCFMHIPDNFTAQETDVRTKTTSSIVEEVQRFHSSKKIDLFLSYFYNSHFDPAAFDEIHRLGIPTVNFYCNNISQFDLVADIAPHVTVAWYAEQAAKAHYDAVGAQSIWIQMAADPTVYHPVDGVTRVPATCFVGQRYADRTSLVMHLIQNNVPIALYGSGWGTSGPTVTANAEAVEASYLGRPLVPPGTAKSYQAELLRIFRTEGVGRGALRIGRIVREKMVNRQSRTLLQRHDRGFAKEISDTFAQYDVILNFSNVYADGKSGAALIPHVRLRDFEGPMCRTCYLTGYSEEIEAFYRIGEEIDTYRSAEELVDKCRFYLLHPAASERLRAAGYQRAVTDHIWERRFAKLFDHLAQVT